MQPEGAVIHPEGRLQFFCRREKSMRNIILVFIFLAVAIVIQAVYKAHLLSTGKILDRPNDFVRTKQIYTVRNVNFQQVISILRMKVANKEFSANIIEDKNRRSIFIDGFQWKARLWQVSENAGCQVFAFCFLEWYRDYEDSMNCLLTSVEKTFLQLDPGTQLQSVKMETKH